MQLSPKRFVILLAAAALLISAGHSAFGSCIARPPVDGTFERTPSVVLLKLRSRDNPDGPGTVHMSVEKVFKGNLKKGAEVVFAPDPRGSDPFKEAIGTRYLFYLPESPGKSGMYSWDECGRSGTEKRAAADLLYLNKLDRVRGLSRLSGTLMRPVPLKNTSGYDMAELATHTVTITGAGEPVTLKTDKNGVYEIYDLPPGQYKVRPEPVPGYRHSYYRATVDYMSVNIREKEVTELNFSFYFDNEVSGRLVDQAGRPMGGVGLGLQPAPGYLGDYTDADGIFKIERVPPGTYVLAVNPGGQVSAITPFGTFYYPGKARREDAAEITLGVGESLENMVVKAPEGVATAVIGGVLQFSDGQPVAGRRVRYFEAARNAVREEESLSPDSSVITDKEGRFEIKILKGQKGVIFARTRVDEEAAGYRCGPQMRPGEGPDSHSNTESPEIYIDASADQAGLELRFTFPACKQ